VFAVGGVGCWAVVAVGGGGWSCAVFAVGGVGCWVWSCAVFAVRGVGWGVVMAVGGGGVVVNRVRGWWGGVLGCYGRWSRGVAVRHVRSSWGGVSLWPLVEGGGRAPCSRFVGCGGPSLLLVGGGGCGSSSPVVGGGDEPLSPLMGFAAGSSSLSVVGCVRRCRCPSSFSSSWVISRVAVAHRLHCPLLASLSLIISVVPHHLRCASFPGCVVVVHLKGEQQIRHRSPFGCHVAVPATWHLEFVSGKGRGGKGMNLLWTVTTTLE
jgi:hypothetical protein